jgi:hypothetical protein
MENNLQDELEKRKMWFFECQLRRLNLGTFKQVHENQPEPSNPAPEFLDLVTEQLFQITTGNQDGKIYPQVGKLNSYDRIYLDSQQPIWSSNERQQREDLKDFIGNIGNWLDYKQPKKISSKNIRY